ncbi:MAG TPA: hypothetical protein VGC32_13585 [Solirubrobacterales bacterium]
MAVRRRPDRGGECCFLVLSTSALSERGPRGPRGGSGNLRVHLDLSATALSEARDGDEIRAYVDAEDAALALSTAMQEIEFLR